MSELWALNIVGTRVDLRSDIMACKIIMRGLDLAVKWADLIVGLTPECCSRAG